MGCASSSSAAAGQPRAPAQASTPVSEAITNSGDKVSKKQQQPAEIKLEAVQNFSPEQDDDVDLADVDRLLRMSESDMKNQPLELSAAANTAPPQQKRHPESPKLGALPPIGGDSSRYPGIKAPASPAAGNSSYKATSSQRIGETTMKMVDAALESGVLDTPAEDDPWANLQNKYKPATKQPSASGIQPKPKPQAVDDDEDEVELLDQGRQASGSLSSGGMGTTGLVTPTHVKIRAARLPGQLPPISGQPRAGGWGQGNLAAAGTLMLGDDESETKPFKTSGPPGVAASPSGGVGAYDSPIRGVKASEDLGMEDLDDVDDLINDELNTGGLNNDLASKLARFEAMNDDD